MKALAIGALVGAVTLAGAAISAFASLSSFDGSPPAPLANPPVLAGWDIQVHDQSMARGDNTFPTTLAEHGPDCAGPPATHTVTDRAGAVFQCRDHVMTAIHGDYGAIYLTPNVLVDLSQERVITWSMSTNKASARDWPDFSLSAYADSQALPLRSDLSDGVDLQKPNRNSVVVTTDNAEGAPNLNVIRNGVLTQYPQNFPPLDAGIPSTVNKSAVREPMKLTVSQTRVRFERLPSASDPDGQLFFDRTIAPLGFTEAVFSWGHHSYNPTKDCSGPCVGTWHWDDLEVPGTPFYIDRLATRYTNVPAVLAYNPAPAGSELRFSALCRPVINGVPLTKMTDSGHPESTASYRVPVAAGSTMVSLGFADDGWYDVGLGCHAKDFAIWSRSGGAPSPTSTGAATPTPTASPSPSATPTASPTVSPTPSPTLTATPSATPDSRRYRCQVQARPGAPWTNVWSGSPAGRVCP